jgi:choline dehydrogenase
MAVPSAEVVVVGSGSAGAVIAARATEDGACDVMLLEAGRDYANVEPLPPDLVDGTRNSLRGPHDWGWVHRPRPSHPPFYFPRGKVVGGSSAVNTCIAIRGQPYDYDEWAERGLREWSFSECLPAFKRLENDLDVRNEWHSQDGPIPIRRHPREELVPWQAAFVEACAHLGFERCEDTNDPTTTGVGPHAMNKVNGVRMSAARYLSQDVRRRAGLRIAARTLVRRVRLRDRRVVGVEAERDGRVFNIACDRVVLSAGAIATPGILLRSGIGPRDVVERLGVDLVADVPAVGARLLDHPGFAIFLRPTRVAEQRLDHPLIQTVLRYSAASSTRRNDMILQPGSILPLARITLPLVSLMSNVPKPRGHGRLVFESASVHATPRIESRLLFDEHDRARAVESMQLAVECAMSPPMRGLATFFWPPASIVTKRDKLARWLSILCDSGYHPCGTVPMGADADGGAACDGRGRVRGVEGLVVADASLMPTIPTANTNLPTLMIGERFGAWLRDGVL